MITCIAIDDEPIALSIIQEYCRRIGDMELQTFTSPVAGMASIAETCPDIVFLDIEMNGYNGIALARQLPANCCLIFTTRSMRWTVLKSMRWISCTNRYSFPGSRELWQKPGHGSMQGENPKTTFSINRVRSRTCSMIRSY